MIVFWSRDGKVRPRRVTQAQGAASVMVWAAVTKSGRSSLVFVEQGVKLNQENYRNDIPVGSLLHWSKVHFKNRPWMLINYKLPSVSYCITHTTPKLSAQPRFLNFNLSSGTVCLNQVLSQSWSHIVSYIIVTYGHI